MKLLYKKFCDVHSFSTNPLDVRPLVMECVKHLREKYFTLPLSLSVIFFLKIGRPW